MTLRAVFFFGRARALTAGGFFISAQQEPIPAPIVSGMANAALALGTVAGYEKTGGYGSEAGQQPLRDAIVKRFYSENTKINASEIFVSDGSKCDISRMQQMFGPGRKVAVQDPAYPAYVDSSVINGHCTGYDEKTKRYENIVYMECVPGNDFFPNLEAAKEADIIFFCSPNNPTGAAATRAQCKELVDFANKNGQIVIFDAAYAFYIENPDCPKTIFEIEGAETCCIESCSFSKYAGFTGLRLGWTVVPEALKFADGSSVRFDWNRCMATAFNGASNVAQGGGLAALSDEGWKSMQETVGFYKENAKMLKKTFEELGFKVYGAVDAPYVWVDFDGRDSWEVFTEILTKTDIVTTPGAGFGPTGDGFVRMSAFCHRGNLETAIERLKKEFGK